VLHLIDRISLGGAQRIVISLLNNNKKQSLDIKLQTLKKTNKKQFVKKIENNNKFSLLKILKLIKTINSPRYDLIHCHLSKSIIFCLLFANKNKKIIVHEHGKILRKGLLYEFCLKIFKHKVDLFLAVSRTVKQKLISKAKIPENKIKVLYNPINLKEFSPDNKSKAEIKSEKEKLDIKDIEFVIGFVGRLSKVKGCKYLIKSLQYLDFKYKLLILGDGPERKNLEKLSENLEIRNNVEFLGYKESVKKYYSLSDLVVIPSLSESFGLVALEAQAMGVPVICSEIPAFKEILSNKKNALFFESQNEKDLTDKIKKIYSEEKLSKKLIRNGLENVKNYDLETYINNLTEVYKKINV
ncbi:MAG: glycosyltransferase family 4 protein, partial [Atribacterota bacterium]